MKTFKVYWKGGTTEILLGINIAEAFNAAGYTSEEHLGAMDKYIPVIHPDADSVELAVFSCFRCKGYPDTTREVDNKFGIHCPDCNQNSRSTVYYGNEEDARLAWNKKQLSMSGIPMA